MRQGVCPLGAKLRCSTSKANSMADVRTTRRFRFSLRTMFAVAGALAVFAWVCAGGLGVGAASEPVGNYHGSDKEPEGVRHQPKNVSSSPIGSCLVHGGYRPAHYHEEPTGAILEERPASGNVRLKPSGHGRITASNGRVNTAAKSSPNEHQCSGEQHKRADEDFIHGSGPEPVGGSNISSKRRTAREKNGTSWTPFVFGLGG